MENELKGIREEGDWDPEAGERQYVTKRGDGQLGWLVMRAGVQKVRLDRGAQNIVVDFNDGWETVEEHRPFSRAQLAVVAFEADCALLRLIGDHERSRRKWGDLSDKARIAYIEKGPLNPPIRRMVYNAIMATLEKNI